MGRLFQPARFSPGIVPLVNSKQYTTGQTFKKGAVLIYTAAGEVSEGGADPTPIAGVSLEAAGSKPGFDAANSPTQFTGRVQEVSMAMADRITTWTGRMTNAGVDVVPTQTMIDELYGIVKVGNDWTIDQTDVVNTRLEIVDIDIDNKIFFFKWLEAQLANP
jgi:hypothetical protein